MFSLSYYIPVDDHERVKLALFAKGAGSIGQYDQCCWEVKGRGQFCALQGSQPRTGQMNQLVQLEEYKVEMVCADDKVREVVKTLLDEHPYEQPAYRVNRIMTLDDFSD